MSVLKVFLWVIAFAIFLIYNIASMIWYRHRPANFSLHQNLKIRSAWIETMMYRSGTDILAIQTFRNSILSGTFLAGVSNVIAFFSLREAIDQKDQDDPNVLVEIQFLALGATFFIAFFFFAYSVRMYNHAGYVVNADDTGLKLPEHLIKTKKKKKNEILNSSVDDEEKKLGVVELEPINPDVSVDLNMTLRQSNVSQAKKILKRATISFYMGTRTIFLAILVGVWIANEWLMLAVSVVLLPIMFLNDHI